MLNVTDMIIFMTVYDILEIDLMTAKRSNYAI